MGLYGSRELHVAIGLLSIHRTQSRHVGPASSWHRLRLMSTLCTADRQTEIQDGERAGRGRSSERAHDGGRDIAKPR